MLQNTCGKNMRKLNLNQTFATFLQHNTMNFDMEKHLFKIKMSMWFNKGTMLWLLWKLSTILHTAIGTPEGL